MSLEYFNISQSTGNANSTSQILSQNTLAYNNILSYGNVFTYLYPVYRLEGASLRYYEIDYNSITYEITNGKTYTLFFSGESLSSVVNHTGTTEMIHRLYRLPFTAYTSFLNQINNEDLNIEQYFTTPLIDVVQNVSAITITNDTYVYNFPILYKTVGNFTENVFSDKDQFLLDTLFRFELDNDLTLGDSYYIDSGTNLPTRLFLDPSPTSIYTSNLGPQEIVGNTPLSGTIINGAFFTYFVPPKKPNLNVSEGRQQIAVKGTITNLSPVFNFANVDDGDYYTLQVNYDIVDTVFSGSNIYYYTINKQVGDAEFVRTFSTPLRANDDFNYRIGNTKEIENIFGNKQTITTWSDYIYVNIESSGLYYFSGYTWRNFISSTFNGSFIISGMTIAGGTPNQRNFTFDTIDVGALMQPDTISASTNGLDTVLVNYNGSLTTLDWRNAVYSATNWSDLGLYIVGESPFTAITDSSFTFSTRTQAMSGVTLTLTEIYNNTNLDLSIDLRSSRDIALTTTENYVGLSTGIVYNRVSGPDGYYDFGFLNGGYYRLQARPPSPTYTAYEPIDIFITINSNLTLNLVFYIIWGNTNFTFDNLSNETFL